MQRRSRKHDAPLSLFSFQDIMACLTGVLILVVLVLAIEGLSNEMRMAAARSTPAAQVASAEEVAAQTEAVQQELAALQQELQARQQGGVVTQQEVEVLEERSRAVAQQHAALRARVQALDDEAAQIAADQQALRAQQAQVDEQRVQAEVAARRERVRFRPGAEDGRKPLFVEVAAAGVRLGELNASRAPVLSVALPPSATDAQVVQAIAQRSPNDAYAVFVVHDDGVARFEGLRDAVFRRGFEVGWQLWDGAAGSFLEPLPQAAAAAVGAASPGGAVGPTGPASRNEGSQP